LTNTADSIASKEESKQKKSLDPIAQPNKSKWKWPF
jgi:hypothetical protein